MVVAASEEEVTRYDEELADWAAEEMAEEDEAME